ncbi:MAG: ABC transporter permease, partial [Candidatus Pacebacteria bacterium]|nr:ABC transporter permease [Candidatus Paceibacterota bacterium]
ATISTMAVLSIGVLSCVSALKMFGNDRLVFWREASAGISITAYWLAVTLMHLPLTLIFSFLFVAPYYNLILPDVTFLDVWWVFIAVHFACSGGGMLLSVVFKPIPALLCGVMIPLIIGGFLNGVSPPLKDMGSVMTFLCDLSYSRYGVEALMIQQLDVQPDYADTLVNDIYSQFGFMKTHFRFAVGMLFTIGCVMRVLTLFALHGLNRDKRV